MYQRRPVVRLSSIPARPAPPPTSLGIRPQARVAEACCHVRVWKERRGGGGEGAARTGAVRELESPLSVCAEAPACHGHGRRPPVCHLVAVRDPERTPVCFVPWQLYNIEGRRLVCADGRRDQDNAVAADKQQFHSALARLHHNQRQEPTRVCARLHVRRPPMATAARRSTQPPAGLP